MKALRVCGSWVQLQKEVLSYGITAHFNKFQKMYNYIYLTNLY